MKADKSNQKNTGLRWGVGHIVYDVPANNPAVAVRIENGEKLSVRELKQRAAGTHLEIILEADTPP